MNLLPILTCKIKARVGDWAVEGKVELKSFNERGGEEKRKERKKDEGGGRTLLEQVETPVWFCGLEVEF